MKFFGLHIEEDTDKQLAELARAEHRSKSAQARLLNQIGLAHFQAQGCCPPAK